MLKSVFNWEIVCQKENERVGQTRQTGLRGCCDRMIWRAGVETLPGSTRAEQANFRRF